MITRLGLLISIFLVSVCAFAQKISGTVTDRDGNPLPFASILVKGTTIGVAANNHGEYELSLNPGSYTLECRYVGFETEQKRVVLGSDNEKVNFILPVQQLTLKEVIIKENAEDPAYEIIRKTIKKRPYYENQVTEYKAKVYIKGLIRLKNLPDKIFGQKIPEEDTRNMGLDSSGKGIIYLSESITKISAKKPDKVKLEVVSSRVSGSNGFGFDFPIFIDLYNNNVSVFESPLNSRGFISPISDNALNYYKYKFLGSYFEDGNEIDVITVTPKRKYEPLFTGIINIVENDWRVFSCNLYLTQTAQLQILDTLRISQLFTPVEKDIWRIKNQILHFNFNQLGLKAEGNFVNVFSDYNLHPDFPKGFFDKVILKYDSAANKKPHSYWDSIRPVPLEPEEIKDYKTKDSSLAARLASVQKNIDSLRKKEGAVTLWQLLWAGVNRTLYRPGNDYRFHFDPLIKTLQYNTVEGVAFNPSFVLSQRVKNTDISFIGDVRYGFNNHHLNPWAGLKFHIKPDFDPDIKTKDQTFYVAGGKRVSQFFKESNTTGLGNSIGTLLYGRNDMKIYENYFVKGGFSQKWETGISFSLDGEYEDRLPLNNTTDFILNKKWQSRLTPNYPVEIMSSQFTRHQAVLLRGSFSITPGMTYIEFPKNKLSLGSKYPTFTLSYTKGIHSLLGSDVDYDKWAFNIVNQMNLKLAGSIKYNITLGGFLNNKSVFAQDYKHFYASFSHIAGEYVKSLQIANDYQFSNDAPFYTEFLFEHHSNGLITNKIPLLRKLNWNLVEGTNALFIDPKTKYAELFVGLENILKLFRIDFVAGFQNGFKPVFTYRIGFGGLLGGPLNVQRFRRTEKIIDTW